MIWSKQFPRVLRLEMREGIKTEKVIDMRYFEKHYLSVLSNELNTSKRMLQHTLKFDLKENEIPRGILKAKITSFYSPLLLLPQIIRIYAFLV